MTIDKYIIVFIFKCVMFAFGDEALIDVRRKLQIWVCIHILRSYIEYIHVRSDGGLKYNSIRGVFKPLSERLYSIIE